MNYAKLIDDIIHKYSPEIVYNKLCELEEIEENSNEYEI